MNTWTRRLLGGLSLMALGFVGCAEERSPINRVQPNALEKAFFVGADLADEKDNPEFYSKAFVIDQSVNQNGISVGLYSGKDRIKWEITEEWLIARKAYQIAIAQDPHGTKDKANGTVVAKYHIMSHFDIKRDYNPQTGEELNIVVENSSDRPWNERKYMRVDWSTNQVIDPMWGEIFLGKLFGDLNVEPLTYNVSDPKDEDAPHFDTADGYFDVTNKYYTTPEEIYFAPWDWTVPNCALIGIFTGTTTADCNNQEATVRHSFWRVDKAFTDFEPTENTERKMDVVANFGGAGDSLQPGFAGGTTQCWDPQYGYPESCFHQYLNKVNFWAKSHATVDCSSLKGIDVQANGLVRQDGGCYLPCDSDDDLDSDGTADACAAYTGSKGSQCDLFEKNKYPSDPNVHGRCTLPLRDRQIVSRGWWLNKETPAEVLDAANPGGDPALLGSMEKVIHTWNQAMMVALATGREVECRRAGEDRAVCHDRYFEPEGTTQMLAFGGWGLSIPKGQPGDAAAAMVACHAPVRDYDNHAVCGETGEVARNGDQRKHFIYYWPYDSDAPYGGVANLNPDPESGESIGTTSTTMGRSATFAAARYRDFIQYAMGDTSLEGFTQGLPQFIYNKIQQNGYSPESVMGKVAAGQSIDEPAPAGDPAGDKKKPKPSDITTKLNITQNVELRNYLKARLKTTYDPIMQGQVQPLWESLAAKLRGTEWEARIVDPGWAMQTTGYPKPGDAVTNGTLAAASPFRNLDNGRLELWRAQMGAKLAARGICFMNDVPRIGSINFAGISRWYMDKFAQMGLDSDVKKDGAGMWQASVRDPNLVKQRGEHIYRDLYHGMASGIAIHEVGHTLGMRHNFASSWDAPNFMPQYWQLRTAEGEVTKACGNKATKPGDPDVCMGQRYLDPQTDDELGLVQGQGRPSVGYFGNSTCMEYEQDYMSPGLGPYDVFFVKAVYGGVLETFDADSPRGVTLDCSSGEPCQKDFDLNLPLQLSELNIEWPNVVHYTQQARDMKAFDPAQCRPATEQELALGEWRVVHGKICSQSPRDHYRWKDFLDDGQTDPTRPEVDPDEFKLPVTWANFTRWHVKPSARPDGKMPHRWNYRYGESYGNGYLHTNYSDNGADSYEVTVGNSQMYGLTYPQSYFRRGNKEYMYKQNLPSSTSNRYLERARSYHWILEDTPASWGPEMDVARRETFHFLARAIMAPEPGEMKGFTQPNGSGMWDVDVNEAIQFPAEWRLALIDGRYAADEFSNDHGGSWDYLSWIDHAAYNVERGLAMRALLDGRPTLYTISRDTYIDGRNVMKNYRNDVADAVDRLVGGLLSEDWDSVAPWVTNESIEDPAGGLPYRSLQMMDLIAAQPTRPAGSAVVFPNIGYKNQLATIQFAHLYSRMSSDMTLLNKMRVYVEGIDMVGTAFPEAELVKFTDPNSGYTYVARKFGDDVINGKTVDRGIASRMIQHANDLKAAGKTEDLKNYVGVLDAARQISQIFWFKGPADSISPDPD